MSARLLVLFLGFLALGARAQTITFAGNTFYPASTNASRDGLLREYLPPEQTLQDWTKRLGIRSPKKVTSPRSYITRLGETYRKQFPGMLYILGQEESENRWFIDYIVPPQKRGEPKYIEWDFFRAQTNAAGGLVVFQYAERRSYEGSFEAALAAWNIKAYRKELLPILITNQFLADPPQTSQAR